MSRYLFRRPTFKWHICQILELLPASFYSAKATLTILPLPFHLFYCHYLFFLIEHGFYFPYLPLRLCSKSYTTFLTHIPLHLLVLRIVHCGISKTSTHVSAVANLAHLGNQMCQTIQSCDSHQIGRRNHIC